MKQTILILFMIFTVSLFSQTRDSGLWILKEKSSMDSSQFYQNSNDGVWFADTSFTPVINDSLRLKYVYKTMPDAIQFNKYGFFLIYGDIFNTNDILIVKERGLYSLQGDCIFAWEPATSMYEYVVSWNVDHYAYFSIDGKEYIYENLDPDILSQEQKERIKPVDELIAYFQGRLRPIEPHYHCNISAKK